MGRRERTWHKSIIIDTYTEGSIIEEPYECESLTYGFSAEPSSSDTPSTVTPTEPQI